ncbi:MAG: glycerol kinase [Candidatus Heimdallarchaeota archaeon]|nr:glycerol kinase [Candidatus Heimdallarchaeota archaeon]
MKYILSIDAGSTGIRAMLFNMKGEIVVRQYELTSPLLPNPGWIEHDPEALWVTLKKVVFKILGNPEYSISQIAAIGIANQRGSFTIWEKQTGKPLLNLLNWADIRASKTCEKMNKTIRWRILKKFALIGSKITKNPMLIAAAILEFTTDHTTVRLKWALENIPYLQERCEKGEVLFGTIDTWLIHKLTSGRVHATDYTNAATGMLDPFKLKWNNILLKIFNIPKNILPELKDTNGDFGEVDPTIFGGSIPIRAVIGDQQAALFGQTCFKPGEVKISMGSGAFVDMNVGEKGKVSKRGLFPLVAWVIDGKPTYMLEGYVATAGTLIDWLGSGIGLSDSSIALNEYAAQCEDTEGVIFIPTPSGIRFPYFSASIRATILGLSLNTHKAHVARAVFEGIASRIVDIIEGLEKDTKIRIYSIKTDGGVSQSNILLQILADLSGKKIQRAKELDMTAAGAAYIAGLSIKFWKDQSELYSIYTQSNPEEFTPKFFENERLKKRKNWKKALKAILSVNS